MAYEIEIKLKIADPKAFARKLKGQQAQPVGTGSGRVHEWNVIFDTPDSQLAKAGQLLRIRTETPDSVSKQGKRSPRKRTILTFKRPIETGNSSPVGMQTNHHHKVREEIEVEVADANVLTKIFEGLGMRGWFRYEKYRTSFRLPAASSWARGLLIELDETPIGTFVELEGPAPAIDRVAKALGYFKKDYIVKNYLTLYVEECFRLGSEPKDMLFGPKK